MALVEQGGHACRICARSLFGRVHGSIRRAQGQFSRRSASSCTTERPFRVGIIGSGPAGFYSALRILQKNEDAHVDMYEQLPVPFGLVRYGVAPDHPEVKNCQERFEEVAASPRFTFIGNVTVGEQIPLRSLRQHYDALLFAYGASRDRTLGIPGENIKGVYSARAFVGWYNGLPEYENLEPDLQNDDKAIVIGNGNVALDIARILLSDVDALRKTDMSEKALDVLSRSKIKHVSICGRRGPMQAAFTIKEIRELMTLPSIGFKPVDEHLLPTAEWIKFLPRLEQRKYRMANLLSKGSPTHWQRASKSWALLSLLSPKSFDAGTKNFGGQLHGVTFSKTLYYDDDQRYDHDARVKTSEDTEFVEAGLAFRSIGYKSSALHELTADLDIPFDDQNGIIPNDMNGRVLRNGVPSGNSESSSLVPGCYCAGWVKRGPTGVIASTMEDAFASADSITNDWKEGANFLNGSTKKTVKGSGLGWQGVMQEDAVVKNRNLRPLSWQDWNAIDGVEKDRGKVKGKVRDKFTSTAQMLKVLD